MQVSKNYEPSLVTFDALWAGVEGLIVRSLRSKEARGHFVRGLTFSLAFETGGTVEKRIALREPLGEAKKILDRVRWAYPNLALPSAVERIELTLWGLTGESGRQEGFFADVRARSQLRESLRQLEARLGEPVPIFQVREVKPWSRIPEERAVLVEYDP